MKHEKDCPCLLGEAIDYLNYSYRTTVHGTFDEGGHNYEEDDGLDEERGPEEPEYSCPECGAVLARSLEEAKKIISEATKAAAEKEN